MPVDGPYGYATISEDPQMRAYYDYIQAILNDKKGRPETIPGIDPGVYLALLAAGKSDPTEILRMTRGGQAGDLEGRLDLGWEGEATEPRADRLERIYNMLGASRHIPRKSQRAGGER